MFRKNRSLFILLFLAFSLQSVQAQTSLKSISGSLYTWFQEKPQYVLGAVFIGMMTYIHFFSNTKKKSKPRKHKSTQKYDYSIKQIEVIHQGNNSECGFYALKNALICFNHKNEDNFENKRFSEKDEKQLSKWKEIIVLNRKKQTLKKYLIELADLQVLIPNLEITIENDVDKTTWMETIKKYLGFRAQDSKKEKIQQWIYKEYLKRLKNFYSTQAEIIVDTVNTLNEKASEYNITKKVFFDNIDADEIVNDLKNAESLKVILQSLSDEQKETLFEHIRNKNLHIDCNKLIHSFSNKLINEKFNEKYFEHKDDDLDGDEIKLLLKNEISQRNQYFSVIDDIKQALPNQKAIQPNGSETQEEIFLIENLKEMKQAWHSENDYMHLFIIGNMSEKNPSESGHWYLLVVQKINDKKSYYAADSFGFDRTNDTNLHKLIQHFEKK